MGVVSASGHGNSKSSFGILFIEVKRRREVREKKNKPSVSGFQDLLQALSKIKVEPITRDSSGTGGLQEQMRNKIKQHHDRFIKGNSLSKRNSLLKAGKD